MKTIIKFLIGTAAFTYAGCADFLKEDLQGTFSTSTFFKSKDDALLALTGAYNQAAFVSTNNELWVFGDVASDDAVKGGASGDIIDIDYIDNFTSTANNTKVENMWRYYYEGVSRANYILYYVPSIDMDVSLRNRILGGSEIPARLFLLRPGERVRGNSS